MHAQRCGVGALLVPLLSVRWPMQGDTGIDFWCPAPAIQTTPLRLKLSLGYVELAASVRNGRSWPGGRASRFAGVQRTRHQGTWRSAGVPPAASNHPRIPYRPCVGVGRPPSLPGARGTLCGASSATAGSAHRQAPAGPHRFRALGIPYTHLEPERRCVSSCLGQDHKIRSYLQLGTLLGGRLPTRSPTTGPPTLILRQGPSKNMPMR
jgi:hypothetical protein